MLRRPQRARGGASRLGRTLVLGLLVYGLAAPAGTATKARPSLGLERLAPLTLRGASFAPRERLRLSLWADGRRIVRFLQATRSGRFRAEFPAVVILDRCSAEVRAVAVGARSGTVGWKLPQLQCPPAP